MSGRSARVLCLVIAAWAVLFAPGVAADGVASSGTGADAERIAVAMIAPTFGIDGVGVVRPCDDGAVEDTRTCPTTPGTPTTPVAAPAVAPAERMVVEVPSDSGRTGADEAPTRGPPTD